MSICSRCNEIINDEIIKFRTYNYHKDCFKCDICKEILNIENAHIYDVY